MLSKGTMTDKPAFKKINGKIEYIEKTYPCERCGDPVPQNPANPYYKRRYCDLCLKKAKRDNLKKGRRKVHDNKKKKELDKHEYALSPSSDKFYLRNEDEKEFYLKRKESYLKEYDMTNPADETLLSRLLSLELEGRRLEEMLMEKAQKWLEKALSDVTAEIRRTQDSLGITRNKRLESEKERSAIDKLRELMDKFHRYRIEHKDDFIFKCSNCGFNNHLNRINKNYESKK